MKEIWKDIQGYEGLYQISNLGNVRNNKNHILKQNTIKFGYKRVQLHNNKKIKCFLVHRLVAQAFIPNLENKPQVNHIDSCTSNNKVNNLEWTTSNENTIHGYKFGNMKNANKIRADNCKSKFSLKVSQYSLENKFIKQYDSLTEASKLNSFSKSNLARCCNGMQKSANGYIWRYV